MASSGSLVVGKSNQAPASCSLFSSWNNNYDDDVLLPPCVFFSGGTVLTTEKITVRSVGATGARPSDFRRTDRRAAAKNFVDDDDAFAEKLLRRRPGERRRGDGDAR
mmetsp:Transcript_2296/g.6841  ORF Transcript_2296/g.6841 Transcript_2296/m.6841 type:complete len:107 (-) Transcript_2296:512-832(-)